MSPSTPPPAPTDALAAAVEACWQALAESPASVAGPMAALRQAAHAAADRPAAAAAAYGLAHLFDARMCIFKADRPGCDAALAKAMALRTPATGQHWDLAACCDDVLAHLALLDGALDQVPARLQHWWMDEQAVSSPVLRYLITLRRSAWCDRQDQTDEALRLGYHLVGLARATGVAPLLARALGSLGGALCSELVLDEALVHCEEAWGLAADGPWAQAQGVAGPNLMATLSGLGRHADAVALADRLIAIDDRLPPLDRSQRYSLYALALQRHGQHARAQQCLDIARDSAAPGLPMRPERAWLQAWLWNQAGRAADALELLQAHIGTRPHPTHHPHYASDLVELHGQAALAFEQLGDTAAALKHERLASEARQQVQARMARLGRLSLQIRLEIEHLTAQRDAALRERERLAELNAALNEAGRAKTRFLAAASHDLRQPLHALALQSAALGQVLDTPLQRELQAGVQRCATALSTMLDSLLDLSRADAGVLEPRIEPLDPRPLLLGLVQEFEAPAHAVGLRLSLRVARTLSPMVHSDATLLQTVLRNLLSNALRYTPGGGVLVCARRAADGGWRVQVRDSGIGIAPADQARVFEEFFQVGNAARQRSAGHGLGLAIVQRLAGVLGHAISLRSAPGRGSRFELRLEAAPSVSWPAAPSGPEPAAGDWSAVAGGPPDAVPAAWPGRHVAVIEDDPDACAALAAWLRMGGCAVSVGADADQVLADMAGQGLAAPDAVLADLRLPGPRDGADEVKRLRHALGRPLPALLLTGESGPRVQVRLAPLGLPWLTKPVCLPALARWLSDAGAAEGAAAVAPTVEAAAAA